MLRYAKRWLRSVILSLLDDSDSNELEMVHPRTGRRVRMTALRIAGLRIVCEDRVGLELHCLGATDAVDTARYWRLWNRLGGSRLRWADGTKFRPNSP